ncbi:hypothetical protein TNCV_3256531 [Trichonephila clavipes]|nr:hypothetical protein TNCV_3256531 [Trichonephila clavipes]
MMKQKGKRSINLLSNFNNPTLKTDVIRKEKHGSYTSVPCPLDLSNYNRQMNSVDIFDAFKDARVVNVIYREMNLPKLRLKDFRRDISRDLVSSTFVTSRNKRQTTSRSVQIKNKKPYVPKKQAWRALPTSQKDPQENDILHAAQKQSKLVQNGYVVSVKFHCP